MKQRKKLLIIKFSKILNQPRVHRQIHFLKDHYEITTAGFDERSNSFIKHINIKIPITNYGLPDKILWNLPLINSILRSNILLDQNFDLIIAHDPFPLALSFMIAKKCGAKVLLDAHEYTPRQFEHTWMQKYFLNTIWDYLCRRYLPLADEMITVCDGIAEEYKRNYGVNSYVITNAPYFSDLQPQSPVDDRIKLIHHGVADESRKTKEMIYLMDYLDERFSLDLMLMKTNTNQRYYQEILNLAKNNRRVIIKEPVAMPEIATVINNYDIGLYMLWPTSFNTKMALPNKLFEFIQGRLAVSIWPSPEMAKVVKKYNLGIVAGDFTIQSIAEKLNDLSTEDILRMKNNSHKAANILCAENNKEKFLNIVDNLL